MIVICRLSAFPLSDHPGGWYRDRRHWGEPLFSEQRARKNRIYDTAYECGLEGGGLAHARFSVKFYVVALLFVLFDIEVVFLVPWTLVYREFSGAASPLFCVRFWSSWGCSRLASSMKSRKGALDWEKEVDVRLRPGRTS